MKIISRIVLLTLAIFLICDPVFAQWSNGLSVRGYMKTRKEHNVMDYGAKNDSSASARAAFVLAASAVADSGGAVFIPPGKYLIDSIWPNIKSNTRVYGAEGTYLYFGIEAQGDSSRNGIVIDGKHNIVLENLTLIGDADSSALVANNHYRANGILVQSCTNVTIRNCEVKGFEWGIRIAGDPNDVSGGQSTHCLVEGCDAHGNQRDGIIINNSAYNIVRGCRAHDNGKLDYASDTTYGVTWDVNSGDVGAGISIRQVAFGGTEDTSFYNRITDNKCYENRGSGIVVWRDDSTTANARYTQIDLNDSWENRYHGIMVASGLNTTIDGNHCWDNNRPNNWSYNIFTANTYSTAGIHIELWSDWTVIMNNVCWETKVFDTASPDYESQVSGIAIGDGAPKADSLTTSTVEPPPDSVTICNNYCYNNRRYQMSAANSGTHYTARQVEGYNPTGIAGTDTLWYTDNYLFRDGRDNIRYDSSVYNRGLVIYGNTYGVAPHGFQLGQYFFPLGDGTANQNLKTDGSGSLSWATVSGTTDSSLVEQYAHVSDSISQLRGEIRDTAAGMIDDSLAAYLPLAGGTMTGAVVMSGYGITGVSTISGAVNDDLEVTPLGTGILQLNDGQATPIEFYYGALKKWYMHVDSLVGASGTVIKGIKLVDPDSIGTTDYTDGSIDLADLSDATKDSIRVGYAGGGLWDSSGTSDTVYLTAPGGDTIFMFIRDPANDTTFGLVPTGVLVFQGGGSGISYVDSTGAITDGAVDSADFNQTQTDAYVNLLIGPFIDTTTLDTIGVAHKAVLADSAAVVSTDVMNHTLDSAEVMKIHRDSVVHHFRFTVADPNAFYDVDSIVAVCPVLPGAITITRIDVSCNADPTTEPAMSLRFADALIGFANATTIDVITTAVGVTTITTGFDDATVPTGKCVYVAFTADPEDALDWICFDISYTVD